MKAFVHEHGKFIVKNVNEPKVGEGEVIVNMQVAGLNIVTCLHIINVELMLKLL